MPCVPAHLLLFIDVVPCFSLCREVLKLSRDFESLTAKDEKSGASEVGHDDSTLEDLPLPALQFSLGSWIGSTTTPGTSRSTQRRRKPAAELIRRKGGTARPRHGTLLASGCTSDAACRWSIHQWYGCLRIICCYTPHQSTVPSAATHHSSFHVHLHGHHSSAPAPAVDGKDKGRKRTKQMEKVSNVLSNKLLHA